MQIYTNENNEIVIEGIPPQGITIVHNEHKIKVLADTVQFYIENEDTTEHIQGMPITEKDVSLL
jgi:hypothetical protein